MLIGTKQMGKLNWRRGVHQLNLGTFRNNYKLYLYPSAFSSHSQNYYNPKELIVLKIIKKCFVVASLSRLNIWNFFLVICVFFFFKMAHLAIKSGVVTLRTLSLGTSNADYRLAKWVPVFRSFSFLHSPWYELEPASNGVWLITCHWVWMSLGFEWKEEP